MIVWFNLVPMRHNKTVALLGALVVAGCAPMPPERAEFERMITVAAEQCARQYSGARVMSVDRDGRIYYEATDRGDLAPFEACVREALSRSRDIMAFTTGRLADHAAQTSVPIQKHGAATLIPALVNGVKANLLLDTGAAFTVIRPTLAQRAGIAPSSEAPRIQIIVMGGRQISVPIVRARSLGINEAVVEHIVVGVYDALPSLPDVDGVLGGNFLNHFRMTIDGERGQLILVPLPAFKPLPGLL